MSKTGDALTALAHREGKPWSHVIRDYAERGYSWADVADILDVPRTNLVVFCQYRGLSFPWMGLKSPIQRARQRQQWYDNGMPGKRYAPTYTVLGFTGTMGEIADHFEVNKNTLHTRTRRYKMSLEEAITQPVMTPAECGQAGQAALKASGNHSKHWKKEGSLYGSSPNHPRL